MENKIKINNEEISYFVEQADKKNTILFIHGFGSSMSILNKLRKIPNRNYKIIAFDCPGHGKSITNNQQTLEKYFLIADYFINNIVSKEVYVIGHSLGALLAAYIANNPKVRGILLISSPNPWIVNKDKEKTISLLIPNTIKQAITTLMLITHKNKYDNINFIARNFVSQCNKKRKLFLKMLSNEVLNVEYNKKKIIPIFNSIKKDITLIYGTRDRITPISIGLDLKKHLNAKLLKLENIGHSPLFESPEKINEYLLKYFDK